MKRHDLDVLSLVFGVLFVGIAVAGLADQRLVSLADLRWILPVLLVVAGVALVLSSARQAGEGDAEVEGGTDAR